MDRNRFLKHSKLVLVFVWWWWFSVHREVFGQQIPKTAFSCDGRTSGYYADVSTGCQVYHMCDGLGRQFSYKCPSKTLFQQRMLICDHWYMVNCSKSEEDYSANLLIGQQGKHFVEDLQFRRTPRPDLVDSQDTDTAYRKMIGNSKTTLKPAPNLVEEDQTSKYFPPSHWSTEIAPHPTTPVSIKRQDTDKGFGKQIFYKTNYPSRGSKNAQERPDKGATVATLPQREQAADPRFGYVKQVFYKTTYQARPKLFDVANKRTNLSSPNRVDNLVETTPKPATEKKLSPGVNFPSNFKATTPVYPDHVDVDLSKFTDFGNPVESEEAVQPDAVSVNFPSKFQATTPVYPQRVEFDPSKRSEFDIPIEDKPVNFPSNFKATTPVYPFHVEVDPSKLSEFDLPVDNEHSFAVNFASKFKATTPVYPSFVKKELQTKFSGSEEDLPEEPVVNFASNFKATTPVYPKYVDPKLQTKFSFSEDTPEGESQDTVVNFASNFKATTPVYPTFVDKKFQTKFNFDQDPPGQEGQSQVNFESNFKATTPVYPKFVDRALQTKFNFEEDLPTNENKTVNFQSSFKATTPVYPKQVDIDLSKFSQPLDLPGSKSSLDFNKQSPSAFQVTTPVYPETDESGLLPPPAPVNFQSNFQATTPDYPKSVEPTSPDPNSVGLVPPQSKETEQQPLSFDAFKRRIDTEDDHSVLGNTFSSRQLNEFMITMKPEQLKNLRDLWHIPEYQFPLDSINRPSYEDTFSSFQASGKSSK
ncbi:uncharacterized protein LOC126745350 isoform X2 [Anthonomus grandis grandis]|uniref:uncharacterized protein LOC126745350 isoform X2 n=1 Tax=Anthonomus grandis grandis TaxID=2921223 RepID=UPI0021669572|nr:uncharacterized protein LOC126745350 isoform X2 [Anthonomus grandis grandis]